MDCPIDSNHSYIARMVINNINWSDPELGPAKSYHVFVAVAVVEAHLKYVDQFSLGHDWTIDPSADGQKLKPSDKDRTTYVLDGSGYSSTATLAGGFRSLASKMTNQKTPAHYYAVWAWETLSRLRLHSLDQQATFVAPAVFEGSVQWEADCDLDLSSKMQMVSMGSAARSPIASYASLQMSQAGHSTRGFVERGANQLACLAVQGYRYSHVLECLMNLIPLFLTSETDLNRLILNNEQPNNQNGLDERVDFVCTIETLVNADQTYLKMAKDLIISDFPGSVLKDFKNMLAEQLSNYER